VNLEGGCGSVSASGTITVIQNVVTLSSAANTNAQSLCENATLTNITYTTQGATGASFAGLPTGVSGSWASNLITISGSPAASGTYTITLTGGCGTVNVTGSISVIAGPTASMSVVGDGCVYKTELSAVSGLASYVWYKDNGVISGAITNSYSPSTAGDYKVAVSNGTCSNTSTATTISICGVTADGRMSVLSSSNSLLNKEGSINNRNGLDERGLILIKPLVTGTNPVTENLLLYLDATKTASYGGTGTTWTDIRGHSPSNNATLYGSPTFASGSFTFAPNKNALTSQLIPSLSSATFVAWVNPSADNNGVGIIFSRGGKGIATGTATGMHLRYNGSVYNMVAYHWNDDGMNWNSNLVVPKGSWSMIAITISSTQAVAYLCNSNGISSATNVASHAVVSGLKFYIANDPVFGAANRAFTGKLATAMVYSSTLTSNNITALFNAQKAAFGLNN
jgi:hypothetical protein